MAKTNFNFQATLKLRTDEFKKGVRDIQRTLNGLKSSFMSFAGGIGLTLGLGKFTSMIKDTAVALDTAKNVLHNVSKEAGEYAENMSFLQKISKQYGQDLITLVNTFAQFRAAAADTELSITDLRDIYESLTRAAGAFHMSKDRTKDMMIAVQQMFSKGKIAAEELRRQLGNSLPGAFNIMARAAQKAGITTNGTTAELEDMMRKGRVVAEDVLPAFAEELNKITAGANFDSLQNSLNNLKNAWTEFVDNSQFSNFYKNIIDLSTKALGALGKNFDSVKRFVLMAGGGMLLGGAYKKASSYVKEWSSDVARSFDMNQKIIQSSTKTINDNTNALIKNFEQRAKSSKGGSQAVLSNFLSKSVKGEALKADDFANLWAAADKANKKEVESIRKATRAYIAKNDALIKNAEIQKKLGVQTQKTTVNVSKLRKENEALTAMLLTDGEKLVSGAGKLTRLFGALGSAIKSALASVGFGLLITGIAMVINGIIDITKRIYNAKHAVDDFEMEFKKLSESTSTNEIHIRNCVDALEDLYKQGKTGSGEWKNYLDEINEVMGDIEGYHLKITDDIEEIKKKTNEWLELQKSVEQYKFAAQAEAEATTNIAGLEARKKYISEKGLAPAIRVALIDIDIKGEEAKIKKAQELQKKYAADVEKAQKARKGPNNGPEEVPGETNLDRAKKVVDNYNDKIKELNNQLAAGAITLKEYDDGIKENLVDAFKKMAGFGDLDNYLKGFKKAAVDAIKKAFADISEQAKKLNFDDFVKGLDDEAEIDAYDKEMHDLGEKAFNELQNGFMKGVEDRIQVNNIYKGLPTGPKKRDTSFDYKKSNVEISQETAENMEDFTKQLEDAVDALKAAGQEGTTGFNLLVEAMLKAQKETKNLQDAAKVAEWKADIEKLRQEYNEGLISSISSVSSALERLRSLYQEVAEAFGMEINTDSGFGKVLSVMAALIDTFQTLMGVIKSFNELSEISASLQKAEHDAEMRQLEQRIAMEGTLGATEVAARGAATMATNTQAAAQAKLTAEEAAGAVAANTESAGKMPFPYNLIAIAGSVAALVAAFATIKKASKFAKGGIVGGNSTSGDHNIIRANSGEMILTKAQQGTLFEMLNGKKGIGGQVDFRIKGSDLVGTLNNYNNKRKG